MIFSKEKDVYKVSDSKTSKVVIPFYNYHTLS